VGKFIAFTLLLVLLIPLGIENNLMNGTSLFNEIAFSTSMRCPPLWIEGENQGSLTKDTSDTIPCAVDPIMPADSDREMTPCTSVESSESVEMSSPMSQEEQTPSMNPDESVAYDVTTDQLAHTRCYLEDPGYLLSMQHREAEGIGYPCGYTTFQGLGIPATFCAGYYFFDARVHVLNNGNVAFNLGNGVRFNFDDQDLVVGLNAYYDYRATHHGYNQVGPGFDMRKGRFFLCANGYFPVGHTKQLIEKSTTIFPNGLPVHKKTFDHAIMRLDLEEGYFFILKEKSFIYAGVGPYYLRDTAHCKTDTWGGMGHLKIKLARYWFLDCFVSHDSFFDTKVQGQISLNFPCFSCDTKGPLPISRQEIIPIQKSHEWEWDF